ncbi:MAG TPA: beta-propeller fold lactonase family protein [Candidatus Angelobacter sp.]|nr:beta-propeller fold lactonase family protein [Candidatus Angelobacter sp.]
MKLDSLIRLSAVALALALIPSLTQASDRGDDNRRGEGGAVFTMDNAAAANHVLAYQRGADGKLRADGSFATGGRGTGAGLASQGAVVLSANGRWLFACNAGSDEISVFLVAPTGLVLVHKVPSEGKHPISLALHRNFLFVLNAGGQDGDKDSIAGFVFFAGRLFPLAHATHALSADNTNPAEISFSTDGEVLVVTEKDTSVIDTFTVDNDGSIDSARHFQSSGQTPFGFALRGHDLIVSEAFGGAAGASAASSYDLDDDGNLEVVSPSVPTTESSACWVAVTDDGRFAYTANTGSGTISGFRIASDGSLNLLNADGVTGITGTGSSPADMTLSTGSRFLYVRNGNGTISAFLVKADGSLNPLQSISGLPAGATGLAGR